MPVPSTKNATDQTQHRARRIEQYLKDELEGSNLLWMKSRFIASDLDLTTKEVGIIWPYLRDRDNGLCIEKRGKTSSITWKVTPSSES